MTTATWRPWFGAVPEGDGVHFRVWAPIARDVVVQLETRTKPALRLDVESPGLFAGRLAGARAGDLYRLRVDDRDLMPDPASRFQPQGVHGPSEIIDPRAFEWHDAAWHGPRDRTLADQIFYELHVGTFTPEGTFAGVQRRLSYLRELGVTAIELMPVADFPGDRNWGYDGAALFAPARCYGRPDDLRRLVDAAHQLGLALVLDVVYNHFGPDGAYAVALNPDMLSRRHMNPWGAGVNLDGPHNGMVRRMLVENALHWLHEYHVDGFRLDATHAIADDSPTHFLAELTAEIHAARPEAPPVVVAEDHRNLNYLLKDAREGGWGMEGVWADDFHHVVHVRVTGEVDGYYQDYDGTTTELAKTIEQGWLFTGQPSAFFHEPRGTDPAGVPLSRFVIALQTHDQIGNRAAGERLHHLVDAASWRAASALLLLAPETPLLFMGQEWAASSPFVYFTDHHAALGTLVTAGRRQEFSRFTRFADPLTRDAIPDPQNAASFERSRLVWDEIDREPHAGMLRLYRQLIALRQSSAKAEHYEDRVSAEGGVSAVVPEQYDPAFVPYDPAFVVPGFSRASVEILDEEQGVIAFRRGTLAVIVCLRAGDTSPTRAVTLPPWVRATEDRPFVVPDFSRAIVLDTEDPLFCGDPCPATWSGPNVMLFQRSGAVVMKTNAPASKARSLEPEA